MTTPHHPETDAIRAVVALPDDGWQPHDHDTLDAARLVLADLLRRHDRTAARAAKRPAQRTKRPRKPPELIAGGGRGDSVSVAGQPMGFPALGPSCHTLPSTRPGASIGPK